MIAVNVVSCWLLVEKNFDSECRGCEWRSGEKSNSLLCFLLYCWSTLLIEASRENVQWSHGDQTPSFSNLKPLKSTISKRGINLADLELPLFSHFSFVCCFICFVSALHSWVSESGKGKAGVVTASGHIETCSSFRCASTFFSRPENAALAPRRKRALEHTKIYSFALN